MVRAAAGLAGRTRAIITGDAVTPARTTSAAKDGKGTTFEAAINLCAYVCTRAIYARVARARSGVRCYR